MDTENNVASGAQCKGDVETQIVERADFRDSGRCLCKAFLSLTQSIRSKCQKTVLMSAHPWKKVRQAVASVCAVLASLSKMGHSPINAQLCCMCKHTSSGRRNPKDKGELSLILAMKKWEGQAVCFRPVVSSPIATRTLETSWQQKRKREREDRSIIHGGKKADSKEMWGFGSLPLESNISGLTHKHVTFESRRLQGAQFHHLKCHRLVLSHKPWCHSALDLLADRDGWERKERH